MMQVDFSRSPSHCETMQDKYVTFISISGSCLASLVLQEMQDRVHTCRYIQSGYELNSSKLQTLNQRNETWSFLYVIRFWGVCPPQISISRMKYHYIAS